MPKKVIKSEKLPKPIGPYNHAVRGHDFIFLSGQIPLDVKTGAVVSGGVSAQTRQVLENVKAVLEASGSSLNNVVKATVFLKDMNSFSEMNEVYSLYFAADNAPARSTIEVSRLPKDALVEIEVVAVK